MVARGAWIKEGSRGLALASVLGDIVLCAIEGLETCKERGRKGLRQGNTQEDSSGGMQLPLL